ncbi:hypothetical protein [Saccharothrix luteola]|uniref:hypothetical protein n=1 Tax=Saccharothrix luteola TaxID=2893018 RepID=UPI001E475543|nr:hypothetical protein [Saccharothrix luteola]
MSSGSAPRCSRPVARGGHDGGVPRTWICVRQVLLTFGYLLAIVVTSGGVAFSYSFGFTWLTVLVSLPLLAGVFAGGMVWFIGEHSLDVEPKWIVPVAIASVCLFFYAPIGLSLAYLHTAADRVAVVVVDDVYGDSAPDTDQKIRVADAGTGADLGELAYHADRDLRVGDRLEVLVDPRGWLPTEGPGMSPAMRTMTYLFAGTGFGVMFLITGLRMRRDLRRYRLTGSRLPFAAPADAVPGDDIVHAGEKREQDKGSDSP